VSPYSNAIRWFHASRQALQRPPRTASTVPAILSPLLSPQQLQQLYLDASRRPPAAANQAQVSSTRIGDHHGQRHGAGMDYDDSRQYHPGDEPRHINWRLSARSGELQVKRFREERRPLCCVLLDRRNAMVFGTRRHLKVSQAARVAASTSFAASQQQYSLAIVD